MEWATDLVLQNLARTGITSQTSWQDSLVSFCVPFICWPLSSLSIWMLALGKIFALWMRSHLTVQPFKQHFYIGLLVFHLFGKWNVRSLLEFRFHPSWKQNWVRPIFSHFNNTFQAWNLLIADMFTNHLLLWVEEKMNPH